MRFLTHNSILQCSHGGPVTFPSKTATSMTTGGAEILTEDDLANAKIACPQSGPGITPCTGIDQILVGQASGVRVDGKVPLLYHTQAITNGKPPGTCAAVDDGGSRVQTLIPGPVDPERNRQRPREPDRKKKSGIGIELILRDSKPAAGERYRVTFRDKTYFEGTLDENGKAHIDGIDPGECEITFPDLPEFA